MRYRCQSCEEVFEIPEGDRPRCPKCLRIHDVERVDKARPTISRHRGPLVAGALLILAGGGYAAWYLSQEDEAVPVEEAAVEIGPLAPAKLRGQLESRGLKGRELVNPFEAGDKVSSFARDAARGQASPAEKALGIHDALRVFVTGSHEPYISTSPRDTPLRGPEATLSALRGEEPFEPYSYELAALMVSALRTVGVDAVLAEVHAFEGTKRPADGSGTMGHYVAALPEGESYRRASFYDPSTGRTGSNAQGDSEVLTDLEAVGALLSLKSLHEISFGSQPSRAERLATVAVRLRPRSATTLSARGTVRLLAGGGELSARSALEEYERAMSQRSDPQRKVLVARLLLAAQEGARAEELIRSALEDAPEFAAAHGLMGLVHAANERFDEAQASVTRAEELEPRDPHLGLLWVQIHMAQHDLVAAADAARAVVDRVPGDPQARLMLAQVLHQDARYDAAQVQLRELIRRHPDNDQLRELVRGLFQYDPTDEELAEDAGAAVASASGDGGASTEADGDAGYSGLQLQMGKGLGKVRLGGPSGFRLNGPGL